MHRKYNIKRKSKCNNDVVNFLFIFLLQCFEIIINSYIDLFIRRKGPSPRCYFFMVLFFFFYNLMCSTNAIMKCTITIIWKRFSFSDKENSGWITTSIIWIYYFPVTKWNEWLYPTAQQLSKLQSIWCNKSF